MQRYGKKKKKKKKKATKCHKSLLMNALTWGKLRIVAIRLIKSAYLTVVFRQTGLDKQCRPRSDATERGVWSGSTLIAPHQAFLSTGSILMDLLKF